MSVEKIEIKIKTSDVISLFLVHLKETTDCLTHIYNCIEKSEINIYELLPTDNLPFIVNDKKPVPTIKEQKQLTINWALTKAFEDLINGLVKSFEVTIWHLRIYNLHKEHTDKKSRKEVEKEIERIKTDIEDYNFPAFIEKIESLLNLSLPLREEILSINKIRVCLVHRHGLVGQKDIKNSPTNDLQLKWIERKFWTTSKNKRKEINYDLRKSGVIIDNLSCKTIKNKKTFKLKEKVFLDINEFNSLAYTCAIFANKMYSLMPLELR
jgi:hypothetical protein